MYFVAVYTISGVTSTFLGKNIDGAETGLGTRTDIVWSANDRIELEAVGPIISVMKSGSVLFSVSDSSLQGGAPGIIGGGTLDSLGDNWEGGNLNDTSTSIPAQKGRRFTFLKLRG